MSDRIPNAWVLSLASPANDRSYSVTLPTPSSEKLPIKGDGVLLVKPNTSVLCAIARVYRIRCSENSITVFFDKLTWTSPVELSEGLGQNSALTRVEWSYLEKTVQATLGASFEMLPKLSRDTPGAQAYVRDLLTYAAIDDLLGPAEGPREEIAGMSVRDRYLIGKLAPIESTGEPTRVAPLSGDEESTEELRLYANSNHIGVEQKPAGFSDDSDEPESETTSSSSIVPSAMGMTFCVDGEQKELEVTASWGRYTRRPDLDRSIERTRVAPETNELKTYVERVRVWKRTPSGGTVNLRLEVGRIRPIPVDPNSPAVVIEGAVSKPVNAQGDCLVTLFLVNTQEKRAENADEAWIFQPQITVCDFKGRAVFRKRPILREDEFDRERQALEMMYREHVEFATGHGVSVHAIEAEETRDRAVKLQTTIVPEYEVPVTEAPGRNVEDRVVIQRLVDNGFFEMSTLGDPGLMDKQALIDGLTTFAEDYENWIEENETLISRELTDHEQPGRDAIAQCREVLGRIREGIMTLESDPHALEAFRFANLAMAKQRVHSIYARERSRGADISLQEIDVPRNRSWHPFQLTFLLLSIPAIANPLHSDRTQPLDAHADLLWFPTGGGKTEAYLGLAAFTMAIRRLQPELGELDSSRGLSVIMRYTLRLLTLQQFQRATTLICAMELLRQERPETWGTTPFTIGLWVGEKTTPNTTDDSHKAIQEERDGKFGTSSTPAQLTNCPWCGSEINAGRDIDVDRDLSKTVTYCSALYDKCAFNRMQADRQGIPVVVVDEEIYHRPPSMLIATVDKFAQMAWKGQVRTLFGNADKECPRHGLLWPDADCRGDHRKKGGLATTKVRPIKRLRPPDLIIQDEFHLISGPLGTMVGLYESAVDELCTWSLQGKGIRPKIVASTATVRKAEEQVNNVFLRKASIFPPSGLDIKDNFFSVQRSTNEKPGRRYIGICAPGSSRPAVLIRVYVALLTGAKELFEHFGELADPYMTLVGYFNSLRELGGMRRLAEDDVQTRAYRVQMSHVARPGLAQRSVAAVDELTSRVTSKDIPQKLHQLEVPFIEGGTKQKIRPIDIVLATNMLSVGVDVNRLGLMVVNGQPKNTAEYIQATSRVGRAFPGLVVTVQTWSKPRDLSHFETFEHYHATFYKHVEAQSVTPYAARALDRGLTGTLVSLLRLEHDELNSNLGAENLAKTRDPRLIEAQNALANRAWNTKDKSARDLVRRMLADRADRWVREANLSGRHLGYETQRRRGDVAALLKKPGGLVWDEFTVPTSMREVEPPVRLIMDDAKGTYEHHQWRARTSSREDRSES